MFNWTTVLMRFETIASNHVQEKLVIVQGTHLLPRKSLSTAANLVELNLCDTSTTELKSKECYSRDRQASNYPSLSRPRRKDPDEGPQQESAPVHSWPRNAEWPC